MLPVGTPFAGRNEGSVQLNTPRGYGNILRPFINDFRWLGLDHSESLKLAEVVFTMRA